MPPGRDVTAAKGTILVVEDDDGVRSLLTEVLEDDGYTIVQALDGQQAIELLSDYDERANSGRFCLILLDMNLPAVDGFGVLTYLADTALTLPVVVLSARRDQLAKALRAGAQDTLAKPFDLDRLIDVVVRNCGQ
jgi:DNA-binding response OmpR family regulator